MEDLKGETGRGVDSRRRRGMSGEQPCHANTARLLCEKLKCRREIGFMKEQAL